MKKTAKKVETAVEVKAATKAEEKVAVKAAAPAPAKETPVKEAPVKKAAVKKNPVKEAVYLQYLGKEVSQEDMVKQVKEIWTNEMNQKAGDLKSISLYVKPEDNAAYYVINEEVKGSIAL
jgi:hypothetical protein